MRTLPCWIAALWTIAPIAGCGSPAALKEGSADPTPYSVQVVTVPEPVEPTEPPLRVAADPGSATRFAGDYSSTWGAVRLTEEGGRITGVYPRGTLTCVADGDRLDCVWQEGGTQGRLVLTRQADGKLEGTWGGANSATDGGTWSFEPLAAPGADTGEGADPRGTYDSKYRADLSGVYDSTYGTATFVATRSGIRVDYPLGTMRCRRVADRSLDCDWTEDSTSGKAQFVVESPRVVRGTWGDAADPTNGGPWVFTRRAASAGRAPAPRP